MYTILTRTDIGSDRGTTYESKPVSFQEAKTAITNRVYALHKMQGDLTLDTKAFAPYSFTFSTYQGNTKVVEITWMEEV